MQSASTGSAANSSNAAAAVNPDAHADLNDSPKKATAATPSTPQQVNKDNKTAGTPESILATPGTPFSPITTAADNEEEILALTAASITDEVKKLGDAVDSENARIKKLLNSNFFKLIKMKC